MSRIRFVMGVALAVIALGTATSGTANAQVGTFRWLKYPGAGGAQVEYPRWVNDPFVANKVFMNGALGSLMLATGTQLKHGKLRVYKAGAFHGSWSATATLDLTDTAPGGPVIVPNTNGMVSEWSLSWNDPALPPNLFNQGSTVKLEIEVRTIQAGVTSDSVLNLNPNTVTTTQR
jgi:hypothetical protein